MKTGALVLKSRNRLNNDISSIEFDAYKTRVNADGGQIVNEQAAKDAIHFASSIGINATLDAGIASPAWGIKQTSGSAYKLYSLFNANSDVTVFIASGAIKKVAGFDLVSLVATTNNGVESKPFTANSSVIALNINKPPMLSDGAQYGSVSKQFAQIKIYKENADKTKSDTIIDLHYDRLTTAKLPSEWSNKVAFYRVDASLQSKIQTIAGDYASDFSSTTVYIDANKMQVFNRGEGVYTNIMTPAAPFNGEYKSMFARRFNTTDATAFTAAAYTDIAEVWLVNGGTESMAKQLSTRANDIYNA